MSDGVALIVTEKDNAARRIAEILSDGSAEVDSRGAVDVYRFEDTLVVGLSGHVVGVDFPSEYSDWRAVEPVELVDAEIRKSPTREDIVGTLQDLAREADRVTIATDYDREGELIGKEAYELVREVDEAVPVDRVRFSSITENEVREAFADPDEIDFDLAAAGEARQVIDLVWGAALTRFLSLSARQLGDDFISVGRVQSPTLRLIVEREREIRAFEPEDYWELFADLATDGESFEAQHFYRDEDGNQAERIWNEDDAVSADERLRAAGSAEVTGVSRRTRTDRPPAPFNTTQFIKAAGGLGYAAGQAMNIAEDLYTDGYVTYPRTDNTVYPDDLEPDSLLEEFLAHRTFGDDAESLLDGAVEPTEGDEETTDHPPIHPTGTIPDRSELSDDEWEIYELVVRRFFATVADAATWHHLRVVADADGLSLKANGKRLVEEGYHAVYPYSSTTENYVPDVEEGQELRIEDVRLEDKRTQPPRRYGQSTLIEKMEQLGIGTKCLTGDTKVLVRNDGDVDRIPAAELFENERTVLADGDADIATTDDGPRTISFVESSSRVEPRESTLVSRRPLADDERVFEFVTRAGSFAVTEDHPVYVVDEGGFETMPAKSIEPGDEILSVRREPPLPERSEEVVASWDEFAAHCDKSSKLYGSSSGNRVAEVRSSTGETQQELADRIGTYRNRISKYENGSCDVPVWILGRLDIRPTELHGLNQDVTFENPFPLDWSTPLARVLGNLVGDGSIHIDDTENTVDVRYHNTDRLLVDRFASDVETLFGFRPNVSSRSGRKSHHKRKYQVNVPSAEARILVYVLDQIRTEDGYRLPSEFVPPFVGALFEDEGHISTDGKAFISNTDHDLLRDIEGMVSDLGIDVKINEQQHKLYVRGRRNLELFLDRVPIASDEKFYRGLDRLRQYDVTTRKAKLLEAIEQRSLTSDELAEEIGVSRSQINSYVRELRSEGYVKKQVEGSNRSQDGNRTIRYNAVNSAESIYATILGRPSSTTVQTKKIREYDGDVYDLSVSEEAPNFAVEGGLVVHNSTRHNTIEKLYDRGYIEENPPRPTQLAMAVVEAAEEFAEMIVSEEMTQQLERDMAAIAEGEATLDEVTEESREMLGRVFEELTESREEIGDHLRESLKADKVLGPCPESGDDLLIRRSRYGSTFVGCDGYPDCEFTLPLPDKGEPLVIDETCEEHGLRHVKMLAGRDTFVHGCPLCAADDAGEGPIIGDCPECGDDEGGELAIKTLRNGSRLVGCTRYPDCEYSLPLPRRGDIEVTEARCDEHDLPELVVHDGDGDPWELGCPICNYREYQARQVERDGLQALDGVGEKTAEKLRDAGIDEVEDLLGADAEDLADRVEGISADRIREWQSAAGAVTEA